jgi:hypothetical protein
MKKVFVIAFMLLIGVNCAIGQTTAPAKPVQTTKPANEPDFKFKEEKHDFGKLTEGPKATYVFTFTNTGKVPLIISNVSASCGCTIPDWSKEPVKKGKKGTITVTYNTQGRLGPFEKALTIQSNAKNPTKQIFIKGEVIPAITADKAK